jgi:hypothetical protein
MIPDLTLIILRVCLVFGLLLFMESVFNTILSMFRQALLFIFNQFVSKKQSQKRSQK